MNSKPVVVGLCVGVAAGIGTSAVLMKPNSKRHLGKNVVGKTLRAMGDMADTVSSAMGW